MFRHMLAFIGALVALTAVCAQDRGLGEEIGLFLVLVVDGLVVFVLAVLVVLQLLLLLLFLLSFFLLSFILFFMFFVVFIFSSS